MKRRTDIAAAARLLREQQDISVDVLAARAGLDRKVIYHIERGCYNPTLDSLQGVAGALGLPLWELLRFAERLNDIVETRGEDTPSLRDEHWRAA